MNIVFIVPTKALINQVSNVLKSQFHEMARVYTTYKGKTCHCPEGNEMWLSHESIEPNGKRKLHFQGRLTDCQHCPIKARCMCNPSSANTREGAGRQVSFTYTTGRTATDWMKMRVDSKQGGAVA